MPCALATTGIAYSTDLHYSAPSTTPSGPVRGGAYGTSLLSGYHSAGQWAASVIMNAPLAGVSVFSIGRFLKNGIYYRKAVGF